MNKKVIYVGLGALAAYLLYKKFIAKPVEVRAEEVEGELMEEPLAEEAPLGGGGGGGGGGTAGGGGEIAPVIPSSIDSVLAPVAENPFGVVPILPIGGGNTQNISQITSLNTKPTSGDGALPLGVSQSTSSTSAGLYDIRPSTSVSTTKPTATTTRPTTTTTSGLFAPRPTATTTRPTTTTTSSLATTRPTATAARPTTSVSTARPTATAARPTTSVSTARPTATAARPTTSVSTARPVAPVARPMGNPTGLVRTAPRPMATRPMAKFAGFMDFDGNDDVLGDIM